MLRIFLLYAISGFISLGYQVAWFRIFTDWFGSTNLTFALVVCCFIGGLGLGALWSKPVVNWFGRIFKMDDRLRLYGLVELLVTVTAILTLLMSFLPNDIWGNFPYQEVDGLWVKSSTYELGEAFIAIVCVSVPCFFMGITFPLLCNAFLGGKKADQLPAELYAWNTLGACSGVLACQFMLLPLVGHSDTFVLMVVVNAALGLYFLLTGGGSKLAAAAGHAADTPAKEANDDLTESASGSRTIGFLFTVAFLSGLVAGALEGDMFKRVSFIMGNNAGAAMSAISFWAILAIFLGSTIVRSFPKLTLNHIKIAFLISIACYWLIWQYSYPLYNSLDLWMQAARDTETINATPPIVMFPGNLGQLFLFVGIYVFPAFFLVSFLLPWTCNHLQANRRHLGLAYGLNTLAFCLGMIGFSLLAPLVSIFYSLKLIFVLLVCAALLLLLLQENRSMATWKPASVLIIFIVSSFFVPGKFDRRYVNPGLPAAKYPVTAMKSNGAVTSFVVVEFGLKALFFGNTAMSATSQAGQTYMRLMAHFPLLAQKNPEKALLICFGVGNTASAISKYATVKKIDIVDLNRKVFETAPEFAATNGNVIDDPRVRMIVDDGRAYLTVTDEKYDLITSEPPPPMTAGVYRLYSSEYYQDARAHLTPTGMMTQWLPYYQMPPEAVAKAVNSFIGAFPNTLLISGWAEELILVGATQPIDLNTISERFAEAPEAKEDMETIIVNEPLDMFARIMQTDTQLREHYADSGFISDENNDLEHVFPGWGHIPEIAYNPIEILDELRQDSPAVSDKLSPILSNLGRLNFRVVEFPLYDVQPDPRVKYSDVDWSAVTRLTREGVDLLRQRKKSAAVNSFLKVLQIVPEHGLILSLVGQIYLGEGRPAQAEIAFRRLIAIEPKNAPIRVFLAAAIAEQGRSEEAISEYRKALKLDPENKDALEGLAGVIGTRADS